MIRNKKSAGPFDKGENLHGNSDTTDLRITEEIAWYDGPIYSIAEGGGKIFLRVDDNTGPVGGDHSGNYPKRMRSVVHFLEFPSAQDAKDTLIYGTSPTRTSYEKAISIKREVTTWTLHGPGKADNYRVESCELDFADFLEADLEDELPEAKFLPSPRSAYPNLTAQRNPEMAIPPVAEPIETDIPTIALIEEDHGYSMIDDDDAEDEEGYAHRINQTRYYRGDNVLIAISRLDEPNTWDDEEFEALCNHLLSSWNAAAAGTENRSELAAKLKELVDNARAITTEGDGNLPYFAWQKVRTFCSEHIDTILATLEQANRPPKPITKDDVEQAAKAGHEAHWGEGSWGECGPNERDRDRTFAEAVLLHTQKGSIQDIDYKAEWEAAALARDEAGCPFMTPAEAIKQLADEVAELRKSQAA